MCGYGSLYIQGYQGVWNLDDKNWIVLFKLLHMHRRSTRSGSSGITWPTFLVNHFYSNNGYHSDFFEKQISETATKIAYLPMNFNFRNRSFGMNAHKCCFRETCFGELNSFAYIGCSCYQCGEWKIIFFNETYQDLLEKHWLNGRYNSLMLLRINRDYTDNLNLKAVGSKYHNNNEYRKSKLSNFWKFNLFLFILWCYIQVTLVEV